MFSGQTVISRSESDMAQNNGLLVDVDIETSSSHSAIKGDQNQNKNSDRVLTLTGGEDVNSNSRNIFDAIESVSYQSNAETESPTGGDRRHRERINSVDSTNSIRSYDSTGRT